MKPLSQRLREASKLLAPYAVPLGGTLRREHPEREDETRFPFQRDRDRIIHTQAFRRLKGKTQVFIVRKADHYRTRLTHTMEVAQISRDMARTLGLNEDLAECIALAHDLGHTPFGHAGEEAMHGEMERHGMTYEHNEQSLRIVTVLEEHTGRYPGLNLNREVLEGLHKHETAFDHTSGTSAQRAPTLEAQTVNLADEIAYTAHDTDDGLRAGLFEIESLLHIPLFAEAHVRATERGTEVRGQLIHLLATDAYGETDGNLQRNGITSLEAVYGATTPLAFFSREMHRKLEGLRAFLWEHLYNAPSVLEHAERGRGIIRTLFRAYEADPPEKVLALQRKTGSSFPEAIKDYIAGMTDSFAEAMTSSRGDSL